MNPMFLIWMRPSPPTLLIHMLMTCAGPQILYRRPDHSQTMQLVEHCHARHLVVSGSSLFHNEAAIRWEQARPVPVTRV
jgi:hypothetical protein